MASASKTIEVPEIEITMEYGDLTRLYVQCDATSQELICRLQKISYELPSIYLDKEEWKSKYNSYVVYDNKPFLVDGFNYRMWLKGNINELKFLEYILNKYIDQVQSISNSYNLKEATDVKHK